MTDEDYPPLPTASSQVPGLVDDYKREQDALRFHEREVARLRDEVRSAAEREAAEIVTSARAEIRRIIVNARRDLFGLAAQIQVITDTTSDAHALDAFQAERPELGHSARTVAGMLLPAPEGLQLRDRVLDA